MLPATKSLKSVPQYLTSEKTTLDLPRQLVRFTAYTKSGVAELLGSFTPEERKLLNSTFVSKLAPVSIPLSQTNRLSMLSNEVKAKVILLLKLIPESSGIELAQLDPAEVLFCYQIVFNLDKQPAKDALVNWLASIFSVEKILVQGRKLIDIWPYIIASESSSKEQKADATMSITKAFNSLPDESWKKLDLKLLAKYFKLILSNGKELDWNTLINKLKYILTKENIVIDSQSMLSILNSISSASFCSNEQMTMTMKLFINKTYEISDIEWPKLDVRLAEKYFKALFDLAVPLAPKILMDKLHYIISKDVMHSNSNSRINILALIKDSNSSDQRLNDARELAVAFIVKIPDSVWARELDAQSALSYYRITFSFASKAAQEVLLSKLKLLYPGTNASLEVLQVIRNILFVIKSSKYLTFAQTLTATEEYQLFESRCRTQAAQELMRVGLIANMLAKPKVIAKGSFKPSASSRH